MGKRILARTPSAVWGEEVPRSFEIVGVVGEERFLINVAQRTPELGLRMALGARRGNLLALVLGEGLWLTAAGIGLGLLISAAVTRGLSGLLYGVRPVDPLTFAGVALFLVGVGLMASYWPARRATRVDPLKALRYE